MNWLQEPVWRDGLVLQAQHLQLWSGYQSKISQLLLDCFGADHWGVLEFSFNHAALQLGQYQINKLCARMPGLGFVVYSKQHAESQLNLQLKASRANVYLHCISKVVGMDDLEKVDCYRYKTRAVADYFVGDKRSEICVRDLRLKLSCERILDNSVASIKLAMLERCDSAGYKIMDYFPPCLRADVCRDFFDFIKLLIIAIDKLLQLGSANQTEVQRCLLISHKYNLQLLNLSSHPKIIWRQFMRCYFELCATFKVGLNHNLPSKYEHNKCYQLLRDVYLAWLNALRSCRVEKLLCDKDLLSSGVYQIDLNPWRKGGGCIYFQVEAGAVPEGWASAVKILPEEKIIEAIRYSLPGLKLQQVDRAAAYIKYKVLFDGEIESILQQQDLCLYHPLAADFSAAWDLFVMRDNLWKNEG